MKKKDILDELGEVIIETIYNKQLESFEKIVQGETKNPNMLEVTELCFKLTKEEKNSLINLNKEIVEDILFEMLNIFDENKQYKMIYNDNEKIKDIQKLAAEDPLCNGYLSGELFNWIEKFSK